MDIQIKVYAGVSSMDSDKKIFERIVSRDENISFPYQKVLEVMHELFGACVVQFNVK